MILGLVADGSFDAHVFDIGRGSARAIRPDDCELGYLADMLRPAKERPVLLCSVVLLGLALAGRNARQNEKSIATVLGPMTVWYMPSPRMDDSWPFMNMIGASATLIE